MLKIMRNQSSTRSSNWPATRRALVCAVLFSATAFACISAAAVSASAQKSLGPAVSPSLTANQISEEDAALDLPDAPGESIGSVSSSSSADSEALPTPSAPDPSSSASSSSSSSGQAATLPEASRSERHPLPGQPVPVLTAGDKVRMGFQGAFSPYTMLGWVASAGYEHGVNSSPNWGTDRGAFGQRLWCSAARATSENLFSDVVFAPLFHEDPRYYRLGRTHKFLPRLVYSVSRAVITRSDSGATVPNFSQIFGNAAGSAITYAYYPQVNRTAKDTAETFAGSIGGTALGDVIAEFAGRFIFSRHQD